MRLRRRSLGRPEPAPEPSSHWGTQGPAHQEALAFYGQFVRAGDLVFDVGANVGNRTELFLGLGARVVAFEPQPPCAEQLASQFGADERFTLVQAALGATQGTTQLHLAAAHVLASTNAEFMAATTASGRFTSDDRWTGEQMEVPVSTLAAAIAQFGLPAFVKVDVEGAEPEVLAGLTESPRAISFEFAREVLNHVSACLDRLEKLGSYRFSFSRGESLVLEPWMTPSVLIDSLHRLPPDGWGDVYARRD
jgi:FkbM family methyltransferase